MARWWCSANLQWPTRTWMVRAVRNLFFYNMGRYCIGSVRYFSRVPVLTFAYTGTFCPENERVAAKQYRPLN